VSWLRRNERIQSSAAPAPADTVPGRVERVTPGLAAFFDGVAEDRSHAVLDLGPASESSLRVYGRFARWVRFADLLSATTSDAEWASALAAVPDHPERPYDLVFAWNVLDRLDPHERPGLIARLAEITAPDARLYVVVESGGDSPRYPLRFALLDADRLCYEPSGRPVLTRAPLLPAELERLIAPFKVARGFTSQTGIREYVAVRRGR
jgi:hypothetical protein